MIGRDWRVPLGLLVSINNALGPNAPFAVATVLAIAASVALSTSLEMTSRGIEREAVRTSAALAGSSQVEVVGGELGVPEGLVSEIGALPSVLIASPLINAVVRIEKSRLPLHILGIDLTLAADSRELEVRSGGVRVNDPLRLLSRPNAVLITTSLAQRLGIAQSESMEVHSAVGRHTLEIQGLLEERGIASAFNGQIAVMDVYALQQMLHREGSVDRIDVVATSESRLDELTKTIERIAAGRATVRPAGLQRSALDQTIAALRVSVLLVAILGSLVSGLLSYSAMSTSVERRLRELYVLRSTGVSAMSIARWVALDAALAAGLGTIIGVAAGRIAAGKLVPTVSRISEYFSSSSIDPSDVEISGTTIALAVAVGVVCAFCGAIGPTRIATRRYALENSGFEVGVDRSTRGSWQRRTLVFVVGLGAVSAASVQQWPAAIRTVLVLGVGVGVVLYGVRPGLRWLDRQRGWLSRVVPGVGHLLGTGLAIRPRSTALALAAIASIVAFVHGAIIVSASFGETLVALIAARHPDAILVTAGPPFIDGELDEVRSETVAAIESTPGVWRAIERYSSTILFRGAEVSIVALPARVPGGFSLATDDTHALARVSEALVKGSVCVSSAFARRFSLTTGDTLELSTPQGRKAFTIAGVVPGLAGPSGTIYFDIEVFDRIWPRPGATAVYVWISAEPDRVIDEVRRRTEDSQPLFFTNNLELLEGARKFAVRFDDLLYGVSTLAIVLGAVAAANLLAGIVAARRVEFALLRAAGASPSQIGALVLCDALLVSAVGLGTGALLGYFVSEPMLDLMSTEFGLRVTRHLDLPRLSILALAITSAVGLCSIYPSWIAFRPSELEL